MPIDFSIRNIIDNNGYITIEEMMSEVLTNNSQSYYKNVKSIGEAGDFITSPEISQLFGEIIGLWVISKWQAIGSPKEFTLLELGPGQGKLMRDMLRAISLVKECMASVRVCLYEVNPHFISKQEEELQQFKDLVDIKWIKTLEEIDGRPLITVSNEFFDALPIKQYKKLKKKWYECVLIVDPNDGRIKFDTIELHDLLQKHLQYEHPNAKDGAIVEESRAAFEVMTKIATHVKKYKGGCLAIDYGYAIDGERLSTQYNPTLQAIKNHQYSPIIEYLGEADLSAHVDFQALAKVVSSSGINLYNIYTQKEFLYKYGILIRLQMLQQQNQGEVSQILGQQVYRLTASDQMGELFKVLEF